MRYQKPEDTKYYGQYEYVVTPEGVTIVGFEGEAQTLQLPELFCIDGGQVPVVRLAPYAFYNHRELQLISLPKTVSGIGYHCFFDCRNLETIQLSDTVTEVEDGAFKNCEKLSRAEIRMFCHRSTCMKGILREQNKQMEFRLYHEWMGQKPVPEARLIMPMYQLDFEANVEARIINQITYGSGIHYRECVTEKDVDYAAYDRLFKVAGLQDTVETLAQLSADRLLYPYQLGQDARAAYLAYLEEHLEQIAEWACGQERRDVLSSLLLTEETVTDGSEQAKYVSGRAKQMKPADNCVKLTKASSARTKLTRILEIAHRVGKVASIAFLMEEGRKMTGQAVKESGESAGQTQESRFSL